MNRKIKRAFHPLCKGGFFLLRRGLLSLGISILVARGESKPPTHFEFNPHQEQVLWDIGDQYPNQQSKIYFNIADNSKEIIELQSIKKSCSCINIQMSNSEKGIGGTITFEAAPKIGATGADIIFEWKDSNKKNTKTIVNIRGTIKESVVLNPEKLTLSRNVNNSTQLTGDAFVENGNMGYKWDEIVATSSSPAIHCESNKLKNGIWKIHVITDIDKSDVGLVVDIITISFKKKSRDLPFEGKLYVEYTLQSHFNFIPDPLLIHASAGDLNASFTIKNSADKKFELVSEPFIEGKGINIKRIYPSGNDFVYDLKIDENHDVGSARSGYIAVSLKSAFISERLRIPYLIY